MKNNILISGVNGFVGQNLLSYLKKNNQSRINGVSRKSNGDYIKSYQELTFELWSNIKVFIHLAGKAHDLKKTSLESEYFDVNTELTKTLFNQFLESKCEVFIFMSSVKAVADKVEGVLEESETPKPITAYGKSKLAAEEYILSQKLPEGKRIYVLRPCMIHGPGNKGNLNLLYNFVSRGIPYPFGKYENERSFVSVENLCFIINELIENKSISSGVYNIADDVSLSTKELVDIMGEITNKPARILNIPKFVIRIISTIGDVFPISINSERVQKLTENYRVSNKKIKSALGKELPLSSKEGIQKTLRSF